jgi:hypothetical protein
LSHPKGAFLRRARKIATNYYPTSLFKGQKEIAALRLVAGQKIRSHSSVSKDYTKLKHRTSDVLSISVLILYYLANNETFAHGKFVIRTSCFTLTHLKNVTALRVIYSGGICERVCDALH